MNVLRPGLPGLQVCSCALAKVTRFDAGPLGSLPPGRALAMTHGSGKPRWQINRDPNAPRPPYVLAQTSQDKTAGRFPPTAWNRASKAGRTCLWTKADSITHFNDFSATGNCHEGRKK